MKKVLKDILYANLLIKLTSILHNFHEIKCNKFFKLCLHFMAPLYQLNIERNYLLANILA